MRHIVRPVCAVLGCRLEVIGRRRRVYLDPPQFLYRCTRCQLELWH